MEVTDKILKSDMDTFREAVKIVNRLNTNEHITYKVSEDERDKSECVVTMNADSFETFLIVVRLHEQMKMHYSTEEIMLTCDNLMRVKKKRNDAAIYLRQAMIRFFWLLFLVIAILVIFLVISQSQKQVKRDSKLLEKVLQPPFLLNDTININYKNDSLW